MNERARQAAFLLLALLLAGCPLAMGAVDWRVQAVAALLSALALALCVLGRSPPPAPFLLLGLIGTSAFIVFQALPLPPWALRLLSPEAHQLFEDALTPLGLYPSWRPLSLDAPETLREAAKAFTYTCAVATTLALGRSRRMRERLFAALALSGLLVAGVGYVLSLLGLGPGFSPGDPGATLIRSTFVNPNHLAGLLGLCAWPALGFGLSSRGRGRLLWLLCFAATGSAVFFSLSRGGITAFFAGATAFALLHARSARREGPAAPWWRRAALPAALALILGLTAYLGYDRVVAEMQTVAPSRASSEVKLAMWPTLLQMVRLFPLAGIGRGAFATAFPRFKSEPDALTFTHAENEWLQAPVDLGLVAGLLLLASFGFTWWRAARERELSRPEIGALAGTAALAAQNLVDFSLEVMGVALPFAVAMALLARPSERRLRSRAAMSLAGACLLIAAIGFALYQAHPYERDGERAALERDPERAVELAKAAVAWHPADYLPQAAAGARLVQAGRCAEGLPWLSRAMALNPTAPEPHLYGARCLAASRQHALAKREYRLAISLGRPATLQEALRHYPALPDLLQIAPDLPQELLRLGYLLRQSGRAEDATAVFERAWREYGDFGGLQELALAKLEREPAGALSLSRELREQSPERPSSYAIAADALSRLGRAQEAQKELELGAARLPGEAQILFPQAQLLIGKGRFDEARRTLASVQVRDRGTAAWVHLLAASSYRAQGMLNHAIQETAEARDANPSDPGLHSALADAYAAASRYGEAISTLETAANLPGSKPGAYDARLAELQKKQREQVEQLRQRMLEGAP